MAAAAPIASDADPDLPERLFGEDQARAYRRYLEWSVGHGFRMAIVILTSPGQREALVAWTAERFPGAIHTSLVGAVSRPLIPFLEESCPEPASTSVFLLTGLDDAPERIKLCARINIQRDELAQAFALPWVLLVHPATAMDLRMNAPDFSDFATLWLKEEKPPVAEDITFASASVGLQPEILVSSVAPGDTERAGLLEQAERAIMLGYYDQAADLLAQHDLRAPDARANDARRIRLEGQLLHRRGRLADALACFRRALQFCEEAGDERHRAVLLVDVAHLLHEQGELDEALRIWRDEALPVFEQLGDLRSRAATLIGIAEIHAARGDLDEALRIWRDEVLPVFEQLGDVRARAVVMTKIADVHEQRGEYEEALRIWRDEALPVYEQVGDVRARAGAMVRIAGFHKMRGELDEAFRIWRDEVLPVYERLGDVRARSVTMERIADGHEARGELDEALRIWRDEVLPVYERLGDVRSRAVTMYRVAGVYTMRGESEKALHLLRDEVLPIFERIRDEGNLLVGRANLALLYLERGRAGDRETAAELLRLALQQAEAMRLPEASRIREIQRKHNL